MKMKIDIDHGALMAARAGAPTRPRAVDAWARRLGAELWIPDYAAEDLGVDVVPPLGLSRRGGWVTHVTGVEPKFMLRHPGGSRAAYGARFYPSEAVALAVIFLARLGVGVDSQRLTEPLRRRLARRREIPLLTQEALAVLWAPKEDAGIHTATLPGKPPEEPYALRLAGDRYIVGFGNRNGEHVEIIGRNRGLYRAALAVGVWLPRSEFRALLKSATPIEDYEIRAKGQSEAAAGPRHRPRLYVVPRVAP